MAGEWLTKILDEPEPRLTGLTLMVVRGIGFTTCLTVLQLLQVTNKLSAGLIGQMLEAPSAGHALLVLGQLASGAAGRAAGSRCITVEGTTFEGLGEEVAILAGATLVISSPLVGGPAISAPR